MKKGIRRGGGEGGANVKKEGVFGSSVYVSCPPNFIESISPYKLLLDVLLPC